MASEFWFFSQLHRLGYKAYITLGNTKSVDITVQLKNSELLTFDVKGKETFNSGTYQYLPDIEKENHFFVFVGLQVNYANQKVTFNEDPECYIIRSLDLRSIAYKWESSQKTSNGYGFDQKVLRIIKKNNNDLDNLTKSEQNILSRYISFKKLQSFDFEFYKSKVLSIHDFEEGYYRLK